MIRNFELQGCVAGAIRSDDEMKLIDRDLAEKAFKIQKNELDIFFKEKGFLKYKSNFDLQKEHYGSKTLTANYALIPLYIPHDFLSFDLGNRLGKLICDKDVWWDYSNETVAAVSFRNIIQAIEEYLLPWFNGRTSVDALKQELENEKIRRIQYGGKLSVIQQMWFDSLNESDKRGDYDDVISKNMKVLKLPERLR